MSTATTPARRSAPGGPLAPLLDAARPRLVELLGRPEDAGRMAQAALTVYRGSDQLRACDPESILAAVLECCTLLLELTPALGHAYLVPYGRVCKLMPGYRGFLELVRRARHFDVIQARAVRMNEDFEVTYNPGLTLFHKPRFDVDWVVDRDDVTHVYCYAKTLHGGELVEVMTWEQVEAIRARSKCRNSGPWVTDWLEMAKKTVLRRFLKTQPSTPELTRAYELDNQHFDYADPAPAPTPQNQSGYGKGKHAGQYASPEQTTAYLAALRGFVDRANGRYLDSADVAALRASDGSYPNELREPLNIHQADGHLLKWAVASGRLDEAIVPEDAKVRQLGRYTAIVYHRSRADRVALGHEMERYAAEQSRLAWEKLCRKRPDLFPDDDDQAEPVPAEDLSQEPDHDPEAEAAYWAAHGREEAAR